MKTDQTSSNPVHSPVIAGASTSGLGWGIFNFMKTPTQYEAELESLRAMNIKLQIELTKALEAVAANHKKGKP